MNTTLAQPDETGRMLKWPTEKPLPRWYSWIIGGTPERSARRGGRNPMRNRWHETLVARRKTREQRLF